MLTALALWVLLGLLVLLELQVLRVSQEVRGLRDSLENLELQAALVHQEVQALQGLLEKATAHLTAQDIQGQATTQAKGTARTAGKDEENDHRG